MKKPRFAFFAEVACFLLAILSAAAFAVGTSGYVGMSAIPADSTSLLWTALAICFWLLNRQVLVVYKLKIQTGFVLWGLFFGFVNTMGQLLFAYDTWAMLSSPLQVMLVLLRSVGQAVPMSCFFCFLDWKLSQGKQLPEDKEDNISIPILMLILIVCWLPYLIAFFPGTVCWDLGEMVAQFFGQRTMDTWHPVFTTWLIGSCVWLGRLVGSDNLGAFLFTLIQTVVLAYALAKSLSLIQKRMGKGLYFYCCVAFFSLVPLWGGYAQFISKDTLYSAALLLFVTGILEGLTEKVKPSPIHVVSVFIWGFLSCVLRSNGLYVVAITTVVYLIVCICRKRLVKTVVAMLAAAICGFVFLNIVIPALNIKDESTIGLYSICFQQSARTLRDHANEITDEEFEAIDLVLDAKNLSELYEPWIADPVKFTFKQYGLGADAEKLALKDYRETWFSMLHKYPLTYAETFFAGGISYYTFQPKLEGDTYNQQAGNRLVFETYNLGDDQRLLHTVQPKAFDKLRTLLAAFARGWRRIPILGALYECATYTWLLVGCAWSIVRQCRSVELIAFLPALLSLGVCMVGPVNDYFRYFLPIVSMTPLLVAYSVRHENLLLTERN